MRIAIKSSNSLEPGELSDTHSTAAFISKGLVVVKGRLAHWRTAGNTIVGGLALAMLDQTALSAASFLSGILVARSTSPADFGLYVLGLRIIEIVMEIQNVLIVSPYTFLCPKLNSGERRVYLGSTLVHQILLASFTCIGLGGAALALRLRFGPVGIAPILGALTPVVGLLLFREYARRTSYANLEVSTALGIDVSSVLPQVGGLFLVSHLGLLNPRLAFMILGAGCLGGLSWWAVRFRNRITISRGRIKMDFQRSFAFGKWLIGGNLALLASAQLVPWLLAAFHGSAAIGALAACEAVVNIARSFVSGTQNLIGPQTAHAYSSGGMSGLRRAVAKTTLLFGGSLSLFVVCASLLGDRAVVLLYGPQFAGMGETVTLLSLSLLFTALTLGSSYAISAMNRPSINFAVNLIGLATQAVLGIWLTRQRGVRGAALTLAIGSLTALAVRSIAFRRLSSSQAGVTPA